MANHPTNRSFNKTRADRQQGHPQRTEFRRSQTPRQEAPRPTAPDIKVPVKKAGYDTYPVYDGTVEMNLVGYVYANSARQALEEAKNAYRRVVAPAVGNLPYVYMNYAHPVN